VWHGESLPDATLYRQLVGSLIYLTVTRLDISYAVHLVSQFMSAPRSTHYAVVLRILRYVNETLFHGLHFSSCSLLSSALTLTLTGPVILPTVAPSRVITSYSAPLSFLGVVKNRLLLPDPVLRLSTVHLPILHLNFCGYDGFWQTWVLLRWLVLIFIVIIGAPSRLLTMMSSMSAPSILRLIVTSFGTIFSRALFIFDLFHLKTNLQIFSRSLILLVGYVILFPNSSWLHHLECEGGC